MIVSSFIDSLLEINIYLISLSVLWFVIRHKISFLSQRIILLAIPMLSILIWYFKNQLAQSGMVYAVIPLEGFTVQSAVSDPASTPFLFTIKMAYGLGVTAFSLVFAVKIIRVLFFFKDANSNGRIRVHNTYTKDSFSFFNFIHLRADLSEEEQNVVLEHELIHYQKRHSMDLMIYEIYHSLFWFNPLVILLKKELVNIHEFEVDQEMYATHKTDYMRHLLSYALGSNDAHYLLTSRFYNKLTLKKRIKTMKNSNKTNSYLLLLALPVMAIAFTVVSCQKKETIVTNAPSPPSPPSPPSAKSSDLFKQQTEDRKKTGIFMDAKELSKQTEFVGGTNKLYAYLGSNMTYPESAKADNIEGLVYVNFLINENGEIKEAQVIKGVNDALDFEALRVINTMPNWIPAEKDGIPVTVQFTLPIMFKLN